MGDISVDSAAVGKMQNNVDARDSKVVVTGFGPFKHHTVNASWEAVKLLPSLNVEDSLGVKFVIEEIPVSYEAVTERVPQLWKTHNPVLVVHVGVSSIAKEITLETKAYKSGYWKPDVDGKVPESGCCSCGKDECISSTLDVDNICSEVNSCEGGSLACLSSDAGREHCSHTDYIPCMFRLLVQEKWTMSTSVSSSIIHH
ncbi:pyroglutamyl-peptidase 1 isoform X2 [Ischnura elegans]|uniref:pyroglutamyl-peptidase 1 isoform X2 n=1 Tax=Ischnura elegans TaxID=197161 RepID=UPI001ED89341|nr:pyroglutamyl-peptidase 1 isoform X2 [Ischnura elegans]